jgi:SAM-dependent methyltransferase
VGLDVVRYDGSPATVEFLQTDLDAPRWPPDDASGDVVVSVETIEHLENPRAFFREMRRVTKPGGLIVVTTPNQLSLLSKATLLTRNCFNAFQERPGLYPAHRTALLEIDLIRIARECGLRDIATRFSNRGRIPGTPWHWPEILGFRGRAFSDNILLHARTDRCEPM